jgi:ATP-binding cassette subfamily F protein 3
MERLQKEIQDLDRRLSDPAIYGRDPDGAARLAKARADATKALTEREDEWLALSDEYERATAESE